MKTKEKCFNSLVHAKITLVILFLLPWLAVSAQDFTKTYEKKIDVDKGASLLIKNKFGKVNCMVWEQSTVSITVTVDVEASSQERANRIFDKINVEISGDRARVQGITEVGSISNADFSIDYEVRMPKWIDLDLNNQFGDIYIDAVEGNAQVKLEYGAMEAGAFSGTQTDLMIKFSDAEAGYVKNGTLNIEYSEWQSDGADNLKVITRFSEVNLDKVAVLNLDSQYDEVVVGNAGEVISVSRFSELNFGKIKGSFDFDIEYGELDVEYIAPTFANGKLRNTFAGASLGFDPGASISLDAELQFGDLSFPKALSMNHETVGYTTEIYKGKLGSASGTPSQLRIISKNADVNIDFTE
jgi:hypothetical protein